jgi:hypothetical protein
MMTISRFAGPNVESKQDRREANCSRSPSVDSGVGYVQNCERPLKAVVGTITAATNHADIEIVSGSLRFSGLNPNGSIPRSNGKPDTETYI